MQSIISAMAHFETTLPFREDRMQSLSIITFFRTRFSHQVESAWSSVKVNSSRHRLAVHIRDYEIITYRSSECGSYRLQNWAETVACGAADEVHDPQELELVKWNATFALSCKLHIKKSLIKQKDTQLWEITA